MWDAVRRIFSHDEARGDTPAPGDQTAPPQAAAPDAADATTPRPMPETPADVAAAAAGPGAPDAEEAPETAVPPAPDTVSAEVSPPGHAPQGLAAEATAPGADAAASHAEPPAGTAQVDQESPGAGRAATAAAASAPAEPEAPAHEAPSPVAPTTEAAAAPAGQPAPGSAEEPSQAAAMAGAATQAAQAELRESDATPAALDTAAPEAEPVAPSTTPEEVATTGLPVETQPGEEAAVPPESTAADVPAVAVEPAAAAAPLTPLEPGAVVGDRYTITAVVEGADAAGDIVTYRATDTRSFARCWSCGSTDNGPSTRFCQNCGAPIQDHPVTLVETRVATGEAEEVEQDGRYFHVQPERRLFGAEGVGLEIGAYSAEGPHHPNEDSYWYVTQALCANSRRLSTGIVVFADGMGGYAPGSGLISARIAATVGRQIMDALEERGDAADALDGAAAESIVRAAIGTANQMVLEEIAHTGEMGATLVAVLMHGDTAYVANVGDSRAYYVDPRGRITAITRDQSLVAQEVQQGHLAESEMYTAAGSNIILHAIGEEGVQDVADWYTQALEPASYLLVCSDGYWKTLHGAVVPDGALRESGNLADAARRMVDAALTQGSDDNTTVVLIAVS